MEDEKVQVAYFQTRVGERVVSMSSTLVETVSLNYEEFNDSFLTCSTCLCVYDGTEHTPKLLHCSHTVCLTCLSRIASSSLPTPSLTSYTSSSTTTSTITQTTASNSNSTSNTGYNTTSSGNNNGSNAVSSSTFRCPICRELIQVPRGGVAALPPSFLVNQLLDLMASQRREVVPNCSTHSSQELLFCETCDSVFCFLCVPTPHTSSGDHTVIPFSIAIKRMSQILLYKVNECLAKLNEASESVESEGSKLSGGVESGEWVINRAFDEGVQVIEKERQKALKELKEMGKSKRERLREQLDLIEREKVKVREYCVGLEYQVEVRDITKRISELSTQLDSFTSLRHPRENGFLSCRTESDLHSLTSAIRSQLKTSTTFPQLSTLTLCPSSILSVHLRVDVILETRDIMNCLRTEGGDPVSGVVIGPLPSPPLDLFVCDNGDGTYRLSFTPSLPGPHLLKVSIFERPISDSPLVLEVRRENNPVGEWGKGELSQPVALAKNESGEIFVLDTGNGRIVVLEWKESMSLKRVIHNETLEGRSCTGIAHCSPSDSLLVVNWRSRIISRMCTKDGATLSKITHAELVEPIGVSVDSSGLIYIADNGARGIFIFESGGGLRSKILNEKFRLIGGVGVSPDGNYLVIADTSLFILRQGKEGDEKNDKKLIGDSKTIKNSPDENMIELSGKGRGRFGGVVVDESGAILCTRIEKGRSLIQVYREGLLVNEIDSPTSKLKRPSHLGLFGNRDILVVDLGNDSIKQYRYK